MILAMSPSQVRRMPPGELRSDEPAWRMMYFGGLADGRQRREPQAYRIDMPSNQVVGAHFHTANQYQVFVAGEGRIGRDEIGTLAVHYTDHHTGYGPLVAKGPGFSYFTLRAQHDRGMVYLGNPEFRDRLRPSPKRHRTVTGIRRSIEPVMATRSGPAFEALFEPTADGLAAQMLRAGSGIDVVLPDPAASAGYYVLVVNGEAAHDGRGYPVKPLFWVGPDDDAPVLTAGANGVEALILQFPNEDFEAP